MLNVVRNKNAISNFDLHTAIIILSNKASEINSN